MVDERAIVTLLYRADWRRLSLSGAVHGDRPRFPPPFRSPGESQTDWTLLVAPGGRYRVEGTAPAGPGWGRDGERAWARLGEFPQGAEFRLGGLEVPFPELLEPSWLLAGYDLAVEGDTTACGRPAVRVVATTRSRERRLKAVLPFRRPLMFRADRVVATVDAGLGILLRCESQRDEGEPEVAEFRSLTVGPETDPGQFSAPPGSTFADEWWPPDFSFFPFGGAGREVAKTAAGLAAAGLGAAIRYTPRRIQDPFARATEEAADPDAAMPRDDGAAPDETPGSGAPPVSDEVLHLLYRGGADEPRFTATVHQWMDFGGLLEAVPESARQSGFGGVGFLVDAVRDAADEPSSHRVSSLRIGGWDRYRIDVTYPPPGQSPVRRGWRARRQRPVTEACDGQRSWQVFADRVMVGNAATPREEIACLADGSWLFGGNLTGGEEVMVGGRRAYRVVGRSLHRALPRLATLFSVNSFPSVAAVDAESGRLLRVTQYLGGKAVWCYELRDIAPDASDDFGFEPPAGLRVVEEEHPREPQNLVGSAAMAAMDAWRSLFGPFGGS